MMRYLCEIENIDIHWLGFTSAPQWNFTFYNKKNNRKNRKSTVKLCHIIQSDSSSLGCFRRIRLSKYKVPGKLNSKQMTQPTVGMFLFVCTVVAGYYC